MFDNVIVGLDGRQGGRDAIALTKELASERATVTLAHVYGGSTIGVRPPAMAMPLQLKASEQLLRRARIEAGMPTNDVAVHESSVGRGLHQAAQEQGADLLVIGSCHRGRLGRTVLGSDVLSTLREAPCAVAIAPRGYATTAHRLSVLGVGSDGSPESDMALSAARALAARFDSTIKAMSVIPLQLVPYGEAVHDNWPEIAKQLSDGELRRLNGLGDVEGEVTYGDPGKELASFGMGVDLLIIGSRGVGTFVRWLTGSASHYLAGHAECPLLVFPRSASDRGRPQSGGRNAEASISTRI
jgi:nucleotide-binding universal stress UspA family protein